MRQFPEGLSLSKVKRILLSTRLGELRWTQADLAHKTGIRPNTISGLYHEIADRVSLEQLDRICEALNCDLTDLIVRVPNEPEPSGHKK